MTAPESIVSSLLGMPMRSVTREFPNWMAHVTSGPGDAPRPREIHPCFYGCFDWHSAVHGHWTLVRLLKAGLVQDETPVREILDRHLTLENILIEAEYFDRPEAKGFERPYGWTWLLKLAHELGDWQDPDGFRWSTHLAPLTAKIISRYVEWLPNLDYPVRTGLHGNTAFGLLFALEYARWADAPFLASGIENAARRLFGSDLDAPIRLEPQGTDFLSPSLQEALLMSAILEPQVFEKWFDGYLPDPIRFSPVQCSDPSDGQISHLQGLNLSRAWCLSELGNRLDRAGMLGLAEEHRQVGLAEFDSGHYAGEHWLASFAMLALGF
jgi:hypothetical protein